MSRAVTFPEPDDAFTATPAGTARSTLALQFPVQMQVGPLKTGPVGVVAQLALGASNAVVDDAVQVSPVVGARPYVHVAIADAHPDFSVFRRHCGVHPEAVLTGQGDELQAAVSDKGDGDGHADSEGPAPWPVEFERGGGQGISFQARVTSSALTTWSNRDKRGRPARAGGQCRPAPGPAS